MVAQEDHVIFFDSFFVHNFILYSFCIRFELSRFLVAEKCDQKLHNFSRKKNKKNSLIL